MGIKYQKAMRGRYTILLGLEPGDVYARPTSDLVAACVSTRTVFVYGHNSLYGKWRKSYNPDGYRYVVYSYGEHWPLYVYDMDSDMYYVNEEKYSRTTSRHLSLIQPAIPPYAAKYTDVVMMRTIANYGPYVAAAWRASGKRLYAFLGEMTD